MSDGRGAGPAVSPEGFTRRQVLVIFSGLLLGMLLAALSQTSVSTALPTIVGRLGGLSHLSWVVTAYLLASTVSTPLWGKLGDLYGRKGVFQASIVIFLVGSVLSGFAQNMLELVVFRAVQGLGGGGLIVTSQGIVGDVVSPRERGRYQGIFGAVFGASSVLGPLIGGFLVDGFSWRWVFFVNLPLGLLALVVTQRALHLPERRTDHKIDYLGAALLAGGTTCAVLLTSLGGTVFDWASAQTAILGAAGVALLVAFVFAERRAAEPVLPLSLFSNGVFSVTSAIGFVVGFALFGVVSFLPLFLQVVGGSSPTVSGLELTPMTLGVLVTSIGGGQVISRWGRYKPFPIAGTALTAVGLFLLSRMGPDTGALVRSAYILVLGLGLGLVMQVLVLAVQNAVDYRNLGAATSAATFFRSIGGSFGVAVFGAIFAAQLSGNLSRYLPSGVRGNPDLAAAQSDPSRLQQLPDAAREGYVQAFTASLDTVFLIAVPFALVAFALAWFLREVPLRKTVQTSGVGESYAVPKQDSSIGEIERALTTLVSRDSQRRIYERLARRAGVDLDPPESWLLFRLGEHGPVTPADLAARLDAPEERLTLHLRRLQESGLAADGRGEEPARVSLSPEGRRALDRLVAARRDGLAELLAGWSPEQHEEIARLLARLARELLRDDPAPGLVEPASRRPTAPAG